jgi:hypothetical protein
LPALKWPLEYSWLCEWRCPAGPLPRPAGCLPWLCCGLTAPGGHVTCDLRAPPRRVGAVLRACDVLGARVCRFSRLGLSVRALWGQV